MDIIHYVILIRPKGWKRWLPATLEERAGGNYFLDRAEAINWMMEMANKEMCCWWSEGYHAFPRVDFKLAILIVDDQKPDLIGRDLEEGVSPKVRNRWYHRAKLSAEKLKLSDKYIARLISYKGKLRPTHIPKSLIDAYREFIKLKRQLKKDDYASTNEY